MKANPAPFALEARNSLAHRLKHSRDLSAYTQSQVAAYFGIHQPSLVLLERGGQALPASLVAAFAWLYNVHPLWLLLGRCEYPTFIIPTWPSSLPRPDGLADRPERCRARN